jgi:hypothetical protein
MSLHGDLPEIDRALAAYLRCALWTATEGDDGGTPLDERFTVADFSEDAVEAARRDVVDFMTGAAAPDLDGLDPEMIGHNFSLTRNGHGTGFWDRDLGARGDRLKEACEPYGCVNVWPYGERLEIEEG